VALVYVDVRGVGRKTLINSGKKGIKGTIKTRLQSGEEITLKAEEGSNGTVQLGQGQQLAQDLTLQVNSPATPSATSPPGYSPQRAPIESRLQSVTNRGEKKAM
jgi:hypothetical protein